MVVQLLVDISFSFMYPSFLFNLDVDKDNVGDVVGYRFKGDVAREDNVDDGADDGERDADLVTFWRRVSAVLVLVLVTCRPHVGDGWVPLW